MYLPEDNAQMFDILAELRVYAAMNGLSGLAERLDDALMTLTSESRRVEARDRTAALGLPLA
ncbi:MAG: hypothetical protein U1E34_10565 [Amaricoccus sp.]